MSGYNYILSMCKCGEHWEWSLPGSLSSSVVRLRPTPNQRDSSAILRGHASHERYTVSNVEGREINLHRPLSRAPGIEPGAAAWQAHTLPLALLQPSRFMTLWWELVTYWVLDLRKMSAMCGCQLDSWGWREIKLLKDCATLLVKKWAY